MDSILQVIDVCIKDGKKHLDSELSDIYYNLAYRYYVCNEYKKALFYYRKSLYIRSRVLGITHYLTQKSLGKVGSTMRYLKRHSDAVEFYKVLKM